MRSRQALFQRVSASLIIPVTFLPLAAVLLALGSQLGLPPLEAAGRSLIQTWLPLIFGVGISIGFTDGDGMGVLSVVAGYLTMSSVAEKVAGDSTLNVGVLGGIVTGALCTWAYNRFKDVSLPEYLALFSGRRLGPIAGALVGLGLGYLFGLTWPPAHQAIVTLGGWLYGAGGVGVLVYGALLRLLIPTGLHHILMQLIDYQVGGWLDPTTGKLVAGEYVRFLAGDPAAGRILSGFFLTLGFGPLGAALAITHEAKPSQRKRVGGLMTTAALTAMLLGVTEPVEFAFLFASPLLFGIHILLSGLASWVAWALDIHLGGYALPMMLINWHRQQNGWLLLPLGLAFTLLYYVTFRAVIRWRRPPVLGQVEEEEPVAAPAGSADEEISLLLEALGGGGNLLRLDACMTRLRLTVADPKALDDARLRQLGAAAVLRPGGGEVQVVLGARAGEVAARLRTAMAPGAGQAPVVAHQATVETHQATVETHQATVETHRATVETHQATVEAEPERTLEAETGPDSASVPDATELITLVSPLTGRVVPLGEVPDPVFSGRLAGDGVAVEPTDGLVVSPAAGRVMLVFPGGHALGIMTPEGLELLVHVGIDTVDLHGEGFTMTVAEGDEVTPGMVLGRFDPERIRALGKSLVSPVLVTNPDVATEIAVACSGESVVAGEQLLVIRKKA